MVKDSFDLLFCAATICAQDEIRTLMYEVVEHVIIHEIGKSVHGKAINKPIDKFFKADKAAKAIGQRLLHNGVFLTLIALLVQKLTMNPIDDQRSINVLQCTSIPICAKKDASVTAEASWCKKHLFVQVTKTL